jgi:23S rRNA (pseudouridine1915-N3)-methyltransferase
MNIIAVTSKEYRIFGDFYQTYIKLHNFTIHKRILDLKITLLTVGKTKEKYLEEGISIYLNRLKHYADFQLKVLPDLKNIQSMPVPLQKQKEAELILKNISSTQYVVLLDEKGKQFSSTQLSEFLEKSALKGISDIVFIIAGAFGADESVKKRADMMLSLSAMTFSHQMIRLFFVEQLYRAFTILKGEKYHNE